MSTMITGRSFFQLYSKIIEKAYTNSAPMKPLKYPSVFNKYDGDYERAFFQYLSLVGFGTLAEVTEGAIPMVDYAKEGLLSNFAYTSYALRYVITKLAQREDARAVIGKLPGQLRYSSDQTKEFLFWNVFNFAFNPNVLLADGQPLCSFAHPLQGDVIPGANNTYSNYLGNLPITVESIQQARLLMQTLPDDRGLYTYRTPVKIICPPQLDQVVQETLGSGYYPSSDENRINAVAGALEYQPIEYLTGSGGIYPWFVLSGMGEPGTDSHSIFASVKWDEQRSYYDEPTQGTVHETEFRCVYGAIDGRGVVGSSGA